MCLECHTIFEEPHYWQEKHGLDVPPYESFSGCPHCMGGYTEAFRCDCCDEYITGNYVKTDDGKRYCESCICSMQLGDED